MVHTGDWRTVPTGGDHGSPSHTIRAMAASTELQAMRLYLLQSLGRLDQELLL